MYMLELTDEATTVVKKLPWQESERILKKLESIREHPFPHLKKLTASKLWRLRIGKYRAIIDVIISGNKIVVLYIGKRDSAYKS